MFMKTKEIVEIVELTWNVIENKRVVSRPWLFLGSPRVGTWNVYENKPDSRANLECYRKQES